MARLAAFCQEDFRYPNMGFKQKQRKSGYVVLEDPRNNLYSCYVRDSDRVRGLATSEPTLVDLSCDPRVKAKVSNRRPRATVPQFENAAHVPVTNFEGNFYTNRPDHIQYETIDNESLYSCCELSNSRYIPVQRAYPVQNRSSKRFSYAESVNNMNTNMMINPELSLQNAGMDTYDFPQHHPTYTDNYYITQPEYNAREHYYQQRYHSDAWHLSPWTNAAFLSPPSPLDSGLSSQSVTSSPSFETEFERHRECSCPRIAYAEPRCLSRFDSGRSSPGVHSISQTSNIYPITQRRTKELSRPSTAADSRDLQQNAVRYGKMGLVGEPLDTEISSQEDRPDNFYTMKEKQNKKLFFNASKTRSSSKKKQSSYKSTSSKHLKPCLIVIESPRNVDSTSEDILSSPDHNISTRSQGSASPMSVTASNSATSSNNESDTEDLKKPSGKKATENDIRELEDMYKRCNLSDNDLLDRAERRDLPTAHQRLQGSQRLIRSNSDTLFEMMSPVFRNPYEIRKRAPPVRRAGLPDIVADDMAHRKLKKTAKKQRFNAASNSPGYMLYSTHQRYVLQCRIQMSDQCLPFFTQVNTFLPA